MNGYKFSDEPEIASALQTASRESMKLRLLNDIRIDIEICRLEGWDYKMYLRELAELIEGFLR